MKKTLMATTALVAVGAMAAAQPASAAEKIKAKVGGYMEQWFGYGSNDVRGGDSFDQKSDTEIHFTGSTKLDNGIQFGFNVQLEGQTESDTIDEQYMIIQGSFGRFLMGSENSAHYLMHYGHMDAGIGLNSGDSSNWVINSTGASFFDGMGTTQARANDNDSNKLTYFTPRIEGFQGGVSYVPEYQQDNGGHPTDDIYHDGYSLGANFDRKFNDFRVRLSAGYATAKAPDGVANNVDDLEVWNVGARLAYGGFTVNAAYADYNSAYDNVAAPAGGDKLDGNTWTAGLHYAMGPASASIGYMHGEAENAPNDGRDAEQDVVMVSAGYVLGPGIAVKGSVGTVNYDNDSQGEDNEGAFGVVGVRLSF